MNYYNYKRFKNYYLRLGIIFLYPYFLYTQNNNLQFNRVLLVDNNLQTVPTGKIWKIESAILSVDAGIRKSPSFQINGNTVVLGYDSYNSSRQENVTSIEIQARKTNTTACSYNNTVYLRILGSAPSGAIDQTFSKSFTRSSLSTSFSTIDTWIPSSPGNNVIDKWQLYTEWRWYSWEYRIIINKANGDNIVYIYGYPYSDPGCSSSSYGYMDHLNGNNNYSSIPTTLTDLPRLDVARPQISTQLPIWVPENTTLKTNENIKYLSIIEFNVIP